VPEYPDICVYQDALRRYVVDRPIQSVLIRSPFVLRTVEPDLSECFDRIVRTVDSIGKRLVLGLEDELYLVIHLMIAGRLHWRKPKSAPTRKADLAAIQFEHGTLMFTEASTRKRASIHIVRHESSLAEFDRGGLDVLTTSLQRFTRQLTSQNRTLKRVLTDPTLFSGIGNAYSDEILHAAELSPIRWTTRLTEEEVSRLYEAVRSQLILWRDRLLQENSDRFPERVTAFRPEMAVHGKYGQPCPECGSPVQRLVYAEKETNYCAKCQTGGRILKDRSLSRLLKDDWPKTLEELESP